LALAFARSRLRSKYKTLPRTFSKPYCVGGAAAAHNLRLSQSQLKPDHFSRLTIPSPGLRPFHDGLLTHALAGFLDLMSSQISSSFTWPYSILWIFPRTLTSASPLRLSISPHSSLPSAFK